MNSQHEFSELGRRMQNAERRTLLWRRIAWIELWLALFPPFGIWLLWRAQDLQRSTKKRLLVYTYLIPTLVYFAVNLYVMHRTQHLIEVTGG
jgi:hypothetical protein